jgi:hypothetical protein
MFYLLLHLVHRCRPVTLLLMLLHRMPSLLELATCWWWHQKRGCQRVVDVGADVLVRGDWPAHWEPQEEGMMSVAASFPSVKKPRYVDLEEERQWWLKVMQTGLITLQQRCR